MTTTPQALRQQAGTLYTSNDDATAARPTTATYPMRFGNGLYLLVSPAGTKSWQVRYHDAAGRHQAKILGHWPAMTLEEAERKRDIIQYYKPQIDPQRMRAAAAADRALIQAFTRWKPSTRERRFLDEVFMRAFAAWRATR